MIDLKIDAQMVTIPAAVRKITKAEVLLQEGFYWIAFEFDDGSKWTDRAISKLQAEFETRDRLGDIVLLNGSPLLRPGHTRPAW